MATKATTEPKKTAEILLYNIFPGPRRSARLADE